MSEPGPPAGHYAEFRLGFLAEESSVRVVRKLTSSTLQSWDLAHVADNACVVISELATNGLRAAPGEWMEIRIQRETDGVKLSCWDCSPELPLAPNLVDLDAENGRGLFIIALYSVKHGIEQTPNRLGKIVWAILPIGRDEEAAR